MQMDTLQNVAIICVTDCAPCTSMHAKQVPVVIDVLFKYWIFVGLNKISPGAVVTIKQIDTH